MDVDAAYEECLRVARGHYENFPVASLLLPRGARRHVAAVYAFARAADDFADEGERTAAERLALLAGWRARLHAARDGRDLRSAPAPGEPRHAEAVFLALGRSMDELKLPVDAFDDLLAAFEQDVHVHRYETWADLLDYCRRSANPVGRLVLRIFGRVDEREDAWSDSICTALQLTNFWQDLGPDLERGRVYLPRETQRVHGAMEQDLASGVTPAWREALREAVAVTRERFERGLPLCGVLRGRLRFEIRAVWLGGVRVLDRIERSGFDVISRRPTLGFRDAAWIAARLLR